MIKKNIIEADHASNRILASTTIEGEIKSNGDIRIDGKITGHVNITGKLVVGEKGRIEGEVRCGHANIFGRIKGKMEVSELLTLQATGKINGDVITNKLSVEPGAEFTGSCTMGAIARNIEKSNAPEKKFQNKSKEQIA